MASDPSSPSPTAAHHSLHVFADLAESPSTSERRLLEQVRRGSRSAVDRLFERYRSWLRWWAKGRLPPWVRGTIDTSDLIQDALHRTFARLASFEPRHANALRAYLRRAVENRIRDQLRRATRRLDLTRRDALARPSEDPAPQHRQLVDDETWRRYLDGLERLRERDRQLIVGPRGTWIQLPAEPLAKLLGLAAWRSPQFSW